MENSRADQIRDFVSKLQDNGISGFIGTMAKRLLQVTLFWPPVIIFVLLIGASKFHPFDLVAKAVVENAEAYAALPGAGKGSFIVQSCGDAPEKHIDAIVGNEPPPYICQKPVYTPQDIESASKDASVILAYTYLAVLLMCFGAGVVFWSDSPLQIRRNAEKHIVKVSSGLFDRLFVRTKKESKFKV